MDLLSSIFLSGLKGDLYKESKKQGKMLLDKVMKNDDLGVLTIRCINEVLKEESFIIELTPSEKKNIEKLGSGLLTSNIEYSEFKRYVGDILGLPEDPKEKDELLKKVYAKYQSKIMEKVTLSIIDQDIHDVDKKLQEGQKRIHSEHKKLSEEIRKRKMGPLTLKTMMRSQRYAYVDFWVDSHLQTDKVPEEWLENYMVDDMAQYEIENNNCNEYHICINFYEPINADLLRCFLEELDQYFIEEEIMVYQISSNQ